MNQLSLRCFSMQDWSNGVVAGEMTTGSQAEDATAVNLYHRKQNPKTQILNNPQIYK
jgi:hypothetical protein